MEGKALGKAIGQASGTASLFMQFFRKLLSIDSQYFSEYINIPELSTSFLDRIYNDILSSWCETICKSTPERQEEFDSCQELLRKMTKGRSQQIAGSMHSTVRNLEQLMQGQPTESSSYLSEQQTASPIQTQDWSNQNRSSIYNMSEDFKQVFNYHDDLDIMDSYYDIDFYDVWDRHTCFVKSSISSMNAKNHFCQTDQTYTSFNTYKLNTEADRFWLEFYNSRNIDVPNISPKDGKEGLIFEAQLITNN